MTSDSITLEFIEEWAALRSVGHYYLAARAALWDKLRARREAQMDESQGLMDEYQEMLRGVLQADAVLLAKFQAMEAKRKAPEMGP